MKRKAIISIIMISVIALSSVITIANPQTTRQVYPITYWSQMGFTGSVTGRVTTPGNIGVAGAYVAVVNASNVSQEYFNTTADANGNYRVPGLNATYSSVRGEGPNGQTGADYIRGNNMYRIYANNTSFGLGWSAAFGIDADQSAATTTSVILLPYDSYTNCSSTNYPRTVWSDMGRFGSVVGRATTSVNGTQGIANAYVAVVNASNVSQEYFNTTADANGNYRVTGINATFSSVLGEGPDGTSASYQPGLNMYKIYANKSPYGGGYSAAFGIDANWSDATTTSVVIFTKPARMNLMAERPSLITNGSDTILITATMYDALGNKVADGYNINFTVGNATNNSFTQGSFPWVAGNGSLGSSGNNVSLYHPTHDNTGSASIQFGGVNQAYSGNSSTVWAYYDMNSSVYASLNISFESPAASPWMGFYGTVNGIPAGDIASIVIVNASGTRTTVSTSTGSFGSASNPLMIYGSQGDTIKVRINGVQVTTWSFNNPGAIVQETLQYPQTSTPTPTPTPNQDNGGSDGSISTNDYEDSAGTATATPTPMPTIAPIPTPNIITPTLSAAPPTEQNSGFPWWLVALLSAMVVIVGAGYYFIMRRN